MAAKTNWTPESIFNEFQRLEKARDTAKDPNIKKRYADEREMLFRQIAGGGVPGFKDAQGRDITPENQYVQPGKDKPYNELYGAPEGAAPAAEPWSVENDPVYLDAIARARSAFNLERADALGGKQYQETGINRELSDRKGIAEDARRRLAGNYASRGMGGGRAGALYRAEDQTNARELALRTGLREQLAELNRQFVANYGAEGTDWLGTRRGQASREEAIQNALGVLAPRLTSVG